jgi:hypothetical protein
MTPNPALPRVLEPSAPGKARRAYASLAALEAVLLGQDPARPPLEEQAGEIPGGDEPGDGPAEHDLYPVGPSPLEEGYLEHVTLGAARVDPSARLSLTRLAAAPRPRILGAPAPALLVGLNLQAREAPRVRAPAKPKKGRGT